MSYPGGIVPIPAKKAGENILYPFDFTGKIDVAETISSSNVICSLYSGTDPNPNAMVSGLTSVSGKVVSQAIIAGITGNIYELLCTAITSASRTVQMSGYLAVVPDLV